MREIKVGDRLAHECGDVLLQWQNVAFAIGMNSIGKKNPKTLRERIDPDRSSRKSSVAVGAEWKQIAARTAVARINIPAKSAPRLDFLRALHAGHQLHRDQFENSD